MNGKYQDPDQIALKKKKKKEREPITVQGQRFVKNTVQQWQIDKNFD